MSQVPVPIRDLEGLLGSDWDLCLHQVVPFIDGVSYVKKIAREAGIHIEIVKRALSHLLYYGCIAMIDIFQVLISYELLLEPNSLFVLSIRIFIRPLLKFGSLQTIVYCNKNAYKVWCWVKVSALFDYSHNVHVVISIKNYLHQSLRRYFGFIVLFIMGLLSKSLQ